MDTRVKLFCSHFSGVPSIPRVSRIAMWLVTHTPKSDLLIKVQSPISTSLATDTQRFDLCKSEMCKV